MARFHKRRHTQHNILCFDTINMEDALCTPSFEYFCRDDPNNRCKCCNWVRGKLDKYYIATFYFFFFCISTDLPRHTLQFSRDAFHHPSFHREKKFYRSGTTEFKTVSCIRQPIEHNECKQRAVIPPCPCILRIHSKWLNFREATQSQNKRDAFQ